MPTISPYIGVLWQEGKRPAGTGFLVHEIGLIATCYHVVATAGQPPIGEEFHFKLLEQDIILTAMVTKKLDVDHDVALLQASPPLPDSLVSAPLIRSEAIAFSSPFHTAGFGKLRDGYHQYEYFSASGVIDGVDKRDGVVCLGLSSPKLLRGMSGAPIIATGLDGVVGLLSARYSTDPEYGTWFEHGGWAARSEAIAALDNKLELHQPSSEPPVADKNVAPAQGSVVNIGSATFHDESRMINLGDGSTYIERNDP